MMNYKDNELDIIFKPYTESLESGYWNRPKLRIEWDKPRFRNSDGTTRPLTLWEKIKRWFK